MEDYLLTYEARPDTLVPGPVDVVKIQELKNRLGELRVLIEVLAETDDSLYSPQPPRS